MSNKEFLIVGGSHGIGLGIVQRLAAAGNSVTVISRTWDCGDELPSVKHIELDIVNDQIDPSMLPDQIDGLAYCPGSINLGPIRGLQPTKMAEDYRLNVVGAVKSLQAALPAMKAADQSALVLFSTVAVSQGLSMHSSVAAVKGALEGLTRSWAAELAPKIRVNCIAPSLTDTPLAERLLASDEKRAAMAQRHPLKRVGRVDDIAATAEFLLTDSAAWITGQVIGVDGGMAAVRQ